MKFRAHKKIFAFDDRPPDIGLITDKPWIADFIKDDMGYLQHVPFDNIVKFKKLFVNVLLSVLHHDPSGPVVYSFDIPYKAIGPKSDQFRNLLRKIPVYEFDLAEWNQDRIDKIDSFDHKTHVAVCSTITGFAKSECKTYWTVLPKQRDTLFGTLPI